jgi:hypothetical protein
MLITPSFAGSVAAIESVLRARGDAFERRELWAWAESMKPVMDDDPGPSRWASAFLEGRRPRPGTVLLIGVGD